MIDWRAKLAGRLQLGGLLAMASVVSVGCVYTPEIKPRPTAWAQPVEATGLSNFHKVSDKLYRSARLDEEGFEAAHQQGIRTVVNLRPGAGGEKFVGRVDPGYIRIPVRTGSPSYDEARRFFEVVDDPENTPVLLHCYHGADRTGAFTALYRINRQGWSKDEAIREMTGGGYRFHQMWKSLVEWVREAPEF